MLLKGKRGEEREGGSALFLSMVAALHEREVCEQ